jgi:hypothetical protein
LTRKASLAAVDTVLVIGFLAAMMVERVRAAPQIGRLMPVAIGLSLVIAGAVAIRWLLTSYSWTCGCPAPPRVHFRPIAAGEVVLNSRTDPRLAHLTTANGRCCAWPRRVTRTPRSATCS